jgi:hypothetical protein
MKMMNYVNDAKLDPTAWLLFEILTTACLPADNYESSAQACLKQYKKQFRAAVSVLVWLDLVDPDRKSALGCTPSQDLMTLIARKPKGWVKTERKTQIRELRDALETIIESALKKDALDENLEQCAVKLLGALGLVSHHEEWGRAVPTGHLTNLAAKLRMRERAVRYGKIRYKQDCRD